MRPTIVEWLVRHGLPGWIVPDYAILTGLSAFVLAAISLALARRDGADRTVEARALVLAYLSALAGGYVFEAIRVAAVALASLALPTQLAIGRAAYGGLLAAIAVPVWYLRRKGAPVWPFFDRAAAGTGLTFLFVRTGCFLEGCDYGRVTASPLGVRFPPGSAAASDHALRGWVSEGAHSLPVHPTQLYEALVGALGALVAFGVLTRQRERDGRAFRAFLAVYATGRFFVEALRGDVDRGVYGGLSTAQWVSVAMFAAVVALSTRPRPRAVEGAAA